MDWEPISEAQIWDLINKSYERMTVEQCRIWEVIKVIPEKWAQEPWGNEGKGFWVVAVVGQTVIWFNDIEDGFNRSQFEEFGRIKDYFCNQDELEWQVQNVIDDLRTGRDAAGYAGPPQPIV
ncbi:hypothetical protein [Marinobacterium stanieri]|uniref:hypothetical protein n=1 Tax=Marinobacterium stanieri TaxID=49186 RepID=UPI003A942A28